MVPKEVSSVARHFIKGSRTRKGERLFYSDSDGDAKNRQTVYREHKGGSGSSKVSGRYDPMKGRFKK